MTKSIIVALDEHEQIKFGKGYDVVFKGGLSGDLEFFDTKTKTIAKLKNLKSK